MAQQFIKKVGVTPLDPGVHGQIIDSLDTTSSDTDNAASMRITKEIKSDVDDLNNNLSGFKFYPTGTGIVGLIADDSPYKDANGKYVIWGTATANQLVADNPDTYKSVPSTEDLRGEVGADTGVPFKGGLKNICIVCSGYAGASAYCTLIDSNGNSNLTTSVSVSSDDTFNVTYDTPTGMYRYRVYAKKAGKYRVINNISTGRTDNIVNASVGQLLATVNGAAYSQYYPIWGIATIQYL